MRIAIVPARSGSSRIPHKNVAPFCGKPLMIHGLEAARASGLFDTIHVSTDSPDYARIAGEHGFPVDFLRDSRLAANDSSLIELLSWVLARYDERGRRHDEVCLLYATAPLIEAEDLVAGHRLFRSGEGKLPVLAVGRFPGPVERAFVIDQDGVMRWEFPEKRPLHSQQCPPRYFDAAAFLFIARSAIPSDGSIPETFLPLVLPPEKAVDVNEPDDLRLAEVLFRGRLRAP